MYKTKTVVWIALATLLVVSYMAWSNYKEKQSA